MSLGAQATPAPTAVTGRAARRIPCGASQARWMASEKGKKPRANEPSFKGQMLESITARIAREKEDLRRSALEREARSGGGALPITICECYCLAPPVLLTRALTTDALSQQSSSARVSSPSTAASNTPAISTRRRRYRSARSPNRPGTTHRPRSSRRRGPTSWPSWARRTCRRWTR